METDIKQRQKIIRKEKKMGKKSGRAEKLRKKVFGNWTTMLLFFVIVGLGVGMFFIYREYLKTRQEVEALKDPSVYAQKMEEEDQKVVEDLSNIMLLPDEEFEVQTILEPEKAKEELGEFFKDAQSGDKLIIFKSKAVLYRHEQNLIVNVGPIIQAPSEEGSQPESQPEAESIPQTEI